MKVPKSLSLMFLMSSLLVAVAPARAGLFDLNATTFDGFTIHSQFTAADTLNAVGGYSILSIFGTVSNGANTFAISGLEANPGQPGMATSTSGLYFFDNNYFTGAHPFNLGGVLFKFGAADYEGNVYERGGVLTFATTAPTAHGNGSWNAERGIAVSQIAVVPEPGTVAMMFAGFGLMAFVARRRRPKPVQAQWALRTRNDDRA